MSSVADGRPPATEESALDAVGRILASISGSTLELEPTLDQIAETARDLCAADGVFCFIRDGDRLIASGRAGVLDDYWAWRRQNPPPVDHGSVAGRAVLAEAPVRIDDITEDPDYERPEAFSIGGYRSVMGVPIRSGDQIIGGFSLGRRTVDPFDDAALRMAAVIADQASIAIHIAQLLAAGQQSLDIEQSMASVLAAIANPNVETDQVLQAIAEEAARLSAAEEANIAVREGGVFRPVAFVGLSEEYRRLVSAFPYAADRGSMIGRVLVERTVVTIPDVLADPDYALHDVQRAGGYRSLTGAPIWSEGEITGIVVVGRREVRPFTERELRLIETFASQVAIALRIGRLLTETREALDQQSAVGEVLTAISRSTFELRRVLQTVIDSAVRLSHADDGNVLRDEGGHFRMAAYTAGVPESFRAILDQRPFRAERGSVMGRALLERRPVQVADVLADPEYELREAQKEAGFRTMLGIPLLSEGTPIGALAVWRFEVRPFSESEIALLQTFADQASIAIANVRLFETVERQRTELARFAPQVAGMLTSREGEQLLAGHRREISALFCDLRGFTAFTETAEPEELFDVLRQYHRAVGEIAIGHGGTVEHFAGDGLMVFFNDPTPLPDHQLAAVRTACAMRDRFVDLSAGWRKRGYELGLGVGIATGYATLGRIGFEGRYDYAAIGPVVNLASRLSDVAGPGEVLINQRLFAAVEEQVEAEAVTGLELKGFSHQGSAYRVSGLRGA